MIGLIPAELKRQTGRKGSFLGATVFVLIFGVGTFVWALLAQNPTAEVAVENGGGILLVVSALAAIVVGATAGAYDVDQGTMRYLVLTGRPRWQLVMVRILALPITIALIVLPAIGFVVAAGLITSGPEPTSKMWIDLFYGPWMSGVLYGVLSLVIGTFLRSNGVAIAVAVVLNFGGVLIAGLIAENVSEDLGNAFYPIVAAVVSSRDATDLPYTVWGAVGITAAWLIVLIAAAIARVQRAEY